MAGQSIRPSQFITTYGPGSILEGPDGPRIIWSLARSGLFTTARPAADFDITYPRLSQTLLQGAGIVRLPTNAELNVPDSRWIYDTAAFPSWSLCVEHGFLYRCRWGMTNGCPRCAGGAQGAIWAKSRREAIRFVRACGDGHLDDVDWIRIVNHQQPNCQPAHLEWIGGGALRNIEIRCPMCGGSVNLGLAYGRDWPCSCRFPETGHQATGHCDRPAKIIQRGAANLRVPELVTAINILHQDTPLHRILSRPATQGRLTGARPTSKQAVVDELRDLAQRNLIPASDPVDVDQYSDAEVMDAVADVLKGVTPDSPGSMRDDEFQELQRAATNGAPAVPARTPDMPPIFEVIQGDVRCVPGPRGTPLRVTPVSRLQVTMVQLGYRRVVEDDPFNCALVPVLHDDGQREWYPGVELSGEGIFIDLAPSDDSTVPQHPALQGEEARAWHRAWLDSMSEDHREQRRIELHPLFVWWHTLAHRLMTALAVDSGYSSSAVRERVYAQVDPATGQGRGGILLYTAQPGGDGTLGGLISLVSNFGWVLDRAFRDLDGCSNDPLCSEEQFAVGRYNGAACYACLLVSETSCEFRNTSLDRNLLRNNLP